MSEIQRCPACERSSFACGGACTHEPVPVSLGLEPRWAPQSLAEWIGKNLVAYMQAQPVDGSGSAPWVTIHGAQLDPADAIQRLTKATRRVVEARNNLRAFRGPETKEKWDELWIMNPTVNAEDLKRFYS